MRSWSADEVASWLESISLEEYASQFIKNDIRGSELLCLERRDLKVGYGNRLSLGVVAFYEELYLKSIYRGGSKEGVQGV